MSTISSVTGSNASANRQSADGLTSAAGQEDRFMKLLVAQLRNQDPLNPMDNAQMTSQVAQINTVGGLEKLNRTVEQLLGSFTQLQAQSALQLPGRSVLVAGDALTLAEGRAIGGVELDAAAESVSVEILDPAGAVVRRIDLGAQPAGVRSFTWDGLQANGSAAPEGLWQMRLTALAADGQPVAARTLAAQPVQAVSQAAGGIQLDLGPAGVHAWSAIKSFL